jgi:hypothetical protein
VQKTAEEHERTTVVCTIANLSIKVWNNRKSLWEFSDMTRQSAGKKTMTECGRELYVKGGF